MSQPLSLKALQTAATMAFNKCLKSVYYKEAVEILEQPKKTGDVCKELSTENKNEKELNREMFRKFFRIFATIRSYLAWPVVCRHK